MNNQIKSNNDAIDEATVALDTNNDLTESVSNDTVISNGRNLPNDINRHNKVPTRLINTMDEIVSFANIIANTAGFKDPFERNVTAEDGSITTIVKKEDIIANIVLARELGLEPMQGIILGKTLNREAAIKIQYGKELGISTFAALREIYVWSQGGRETIYTGIGIIEGVLISLGVKKEIIQQPDTTPYYIDAKTKDPIVLDRSSHVIINGISGTDLEKALKNGKKPIQRIPKSPDEIIAIVRLTRGENSIEFPYSLQDAIDAELAPGINSNGEEVKGKDNWAKYPKVMLIHKSTMTAARMIAADRLSGIYIADELPIVKSNHINVDEAQYVEMN